MSVTALPRAPESRDREQGPEAIPAARVRPLPDVERALGWIVAGYDLLYAASIVPNYLDFTRSSTAAGVAVITLLVVGPLLVAALAGIRSTVPRAVWIASVCAFAVAVLVWAVSSTGSLDAERPAWLAAMTVPATLQALMATRSVRVAALAGGGLLAAVLLVETTAGSVPPTQAVAQALLIAPLGVILTVVVASVRRAATRTTRAQQTTLRQVASARLDDLTETERVRTDALVHDTVLTTLLQASSADAEHESARARSMARNALRVIAHVSRSGELGAGVHLRAAVSQHEQQLAPLLERFEVDLDDAGLEDLLLPTEVADALLTAMAEAMSNSIGRAGASRRVVRLRPLGPDGLRIEVEDDGAGSTRTDRRDEGLGDRVVRALLAVEGRTDIVTRPGKGISVRLSWGSVVVADVRSISSRMQETHP